MKDEDIAKLDQLVVPTGAREMKIRNELWFGFALMAHHRRSRSSCSWPCDGSRSRTGTSGC